MKIEYFKSEPWYHVPKTSDARRAYYRLKGYGRANKGRYSLYVPEPVWILMRQVLNDIMDVMKDYKYPYEFLAELLKKEAHKRRALVSRILQDEAARRNKGKKK